MRIALIGQAAFGEKVLAALLEAGEQVAVVFCPPTHLKNPADCACWRKAKASQ